MRPACFIEYQPAKGAKWINVPVATRTADDAWHYWDSWKQLAGVGDYYAVQVTVSEDPHG